MKVIGKYPVILVSQDGKKVIKNNNYEGGFNNADGAPVVPPANSNVPTWLQDTLAVANSGVLQTGAQVASTIKAGKNANPNAGPNPAGTGGPGAPGGKGNEKPAAAAPGMSTGAKVGIALGLVGLGVTIYLVHKHNKK